MKMVVFSTICGSGHFNKPLESPKQRGTGRRSCEEVRLRRRRDNLCGHMASLFQFLILHISNILSGRQIKFPTCYEETQNEGWKLGNLRKFHFQKFPLYFLRHYTYCETHDERLPRSHDEPTSDYLETSSLRPETHPLV